MPETESSSFAQSSRGLRSLPCILVSALAFLLGVVLSRSDAPNENASETVHPQDTSTPEGQGSQGGPRGPLVIHPPIDAGKSNNGGKHNTPFWEKAAVLVALALLIVNTMQMCASKKSADAAKSAADTASGALGQMKRQTNLMGQQLVGTQGAVIEASEPVWNATTHILSITLTNANQVGVTGTVSNFRAKLQRKTWPKESPIGEPFLIEPATPEIMLLRGGQFAIEKGLSSPLPPELKDVSLWPGNEVVTLEGSFTYNDGFGGLHPYKFCYLWLAPYNLTMPTGVGGSGGQWSGGKQGCPSIQPKISEFREYKKRVDEAIARSKQPPPPRPGHNN